MKSLMRACIFCRGLFDINPKFRAFATSWQLIEPMFVAPWWTKSLFCIANMGDPLHSRRNGIRFFFFKVAQTQCQKDKQQALFDVMKALEAKNGSLDGFDPLKVDIISVHEQAARGVSQAESKYHEM
jgi:hypothetical protein